MVLPLFVMAQDLPLKGQIFEVLDGKETPLIGANVYWLDTSIGTITDENGQFSLPSTGEQDQLVISYIGFTTKTITINSNTYIKQVLQSSSDLDEVQLSAEKQSTTKSYLKAANTFTPISQDFFSDK